MNNRYDIHGNLIWNLPVVPGRKKDGTIATEKDWSEWKKEWREKENTLQKQRNNIYF